MTKLALLICLLLLSSCQNDAKPAARVMRVAVTIGPDSLDPRTARLLVDATALNMLYEGLFRYTESGELAPGVASNVTISPDLTSYTFHLREAHWSNGDPVVAEDFVRSWKSQLEPTFPAPNAFLFYAIKNARAAKAGTAPLSSVGIEAPDDRTLVVKLEQPTPYFLELTAFYAYFPFHKSEKEGNGPFRLVHYSPNNELLTERNPFYWDRETVKLAGVSLVVIDERTGLSLFERGELDWVGSPLSTIPTDAMQAFAKDPRLKTAPAAATHWLRFNVNAPGLDNVNLRKALTLALNRRELIDYVVQGHQKPAMSVVPNNGQWTATDYFRDGDVDAAKKLLAEAKAEMPSVPLLTLIFGPNERDRKLAQAMQQQWQRNLGIWVELQSLESKLLNEKLKSLDYQIANGSWFADFDDPVNFLGVFEAKDNGTNNTGWENETYQALLRQSSLQSDPIQRQKLLKNAEALLISEMPIAPIFFYSLNSLQGPGFEEVTVTPLGIQLFRTAQAP